MFDSHFPYTYFNHRPPDPSPTHEKFIKLHNCTFKDTKNNKYIVPIEEYKHHLFVVSFYPKKFKNSPHRYSKLTGIGSPSKVINTCLMIIGDIFQKESNASFAFCGEPIPTEIGLQTPTKRFRIYKKIIQLFFSDTQFVHYEYPMGNFYLLLNRKSIPFFKEIESELDQSYHGIEPKQAN